MLNRIEEEVKVIEVTETMSCDRCNEGDMQRTGITLMCYPEKYEHKCNKCGFKDSYSVTYPRKFLAKK